MSRPIDRMPTRFELSAAVQVARLVGVAGIAHERLVAAFESATSGGLLQVEHLTAATKLLANGNLIERSDSGWGPAPSIATLILLPDDEAIIALATLILAEAPPLWLAGATGGAALNPDLIPDEDWKACCDAVADPHRREALLLSVGRRFETEAVEGLADLGVEEVVQACRAQLISLGRGDLASQVMRVSNPDQLGFDIVCPCLEGPVWRLKVKTARRALPELMLTVTRHEILLSLASGRWALVACVANPDNTVRISGWCSSETVQERLPDDVPGRGEWATARLFLDERHLFAGLPDLEHGPA